MRVSWDRHFMDIADVVRNRSTCIRRSVGAVIVKDKHILATGYNGAPSGIEHCSSDSCIRLSRHIPSGERHELCRGLHAEQNAIIQLAKYGGNIVDSTLYISGCSPCVVCAKMIINSGIKRIVYSGERYSDELSMELLEKSNILIEKLDGCD